MDAKSPVLRQLTNRLDEVKSYLNATFQSSHREKTKFALFANYRSGSTLLANLLNCHPALYCDGEIFHKFIHRTGFKKILFPLLYIQGQEDFSRGNSAYGFDLKIDQLSKVNIHRLHGSLHNHMKALYAGNWKFIHLQRQNLFRQAISNRLANERQLWHKTESSATKAVSIKPEDLLKEVEFFENLMNLENDMLIDIPHIKVIYEQELLDGQTHQATANKIFDYLGLEPALVTTSMRKVSATNFAEDVPNYPEIEQFFKTTRYARFLEGRAQGSE